MEAHRPFGDWLKERRSELDLTQEELAERVGCSAVTIRKIEAGARRPSKQIAALLAAALQIPTNDRAAFARFARGEPASPAGSTPWRQRRPNNLPAPLTRLIGREREAADLKSLYLTANRRLVTITGAPGIGKTRFSLQMAAELLDDFADGAFFVPLAPVTNPDLVLPAIAQALGVREAGPGRPGQWLAAELRGKHLLMVLDNFEQVTAAGPQVAELLAACPRLSALVTSREPLHVRGEQLYPLTPLAWPNLLDLPEPAALTQYPAIALFVERAVSVNPAFVLAEADGAVVTAICAHVDGLPLAIELVAAHCQRLRPADLLGRLAGEYGDSLLRLLADGPRDLPPRHRTLRAAILWSFDMLEPGDQALFARAGVFVGGFTLAAAEAVCAAPPSAAVRTLPRLAQKSLLQAEARDGETRYAMLETMREFALEQLALEPAAAGAHRRHAEFYLALAEEAAGELRGANQQQWLGRLEQETHNLRAALAWLLGRTPNGAPLPLAPDPEMGARLATALWRYWYMRGDRAEGRVWLEFALARLTGATRTRAQLLAAAGNMAYLLYDHDHARQWHEASLELWTQFGEDGWPGRAHSLNVLGMSAYMQDDYGRAVRMHEAALAIESRLENTAGVAATLANLGRSSAVQGLRKQARDYYERSLSLYRELGDQHSIANVTNNLASAYFDQGEVDAAERLYQESLTLFRSLGANEAASGPLLNLGDLARCRGEFDLAETRYRESQALAQEAGSQASGAGATRCLADVARLRGEWSAAKAAYRSILPDVAAKKDRWELAMVLSGLAGVAAGEARWRQAAELLGAAHALRQAIGAADSPRYQSEVDAVLAGAHMQLGPAGFEAAWGAGASMSADEAAAAAARACLHSST